jgi:predicted transcriptional regulator YheO
MNKDVVTKLVKSQMITLIELNDFIVDYVKATKNVELSAIELNSIAQLIQNGLFDIKYAAKRAAEILGMTVLTILDKNGNTIKVNVY